MTHATIPHPAPHRDRVSLWALAFGTCGAPSFWFLQLLAGYGISSIACYGSDHPTVVQSPSLLRGILLAFDVLAIVAALAAGYVSYLSWRAVRNEKEGGHLETMDIGDGRSRFLALWGMMGSLWFFGAILFTTIASMGSPLCVK